MVYAWTLERVIIPFRCVTDTFLNHKRDTGSLKTRELKVTMIVIDNIEESHARRKRKVFYTL